MEKSSHRWWFGAIASLLAIIGMGLFFLGLMMPAQAQGVRSLQVWPDRSVGVTSGLLMGATTPAGTQVFPVGGYRTAEGDVVYARTYLHFPLDVFPPGTEILRATLHMYVDGSSGVGEVTLGVYRGLELWEEDSWEADPDTWPTFLAAPIAVMTARFDEVVPVPPVSITLPTLTFVPTKTPAPTLSVTPTPTEKLLPTLPASPLATPPISPLLTLTPLPTPTPLPTLVSPRTWPVVPLSRVAETWLVWDVTALVRSWLSGEVADDGMVLASAPDPSAAPEAMGNMVLARWLSADDFDTRPHIVVEFEVHPVVPTSTPPTSPLSTPTATPWPVLPPAGDSTGWKAMGVLFIGMALLLLGLMRSRKE